MTPSARLDDGLNDQGGTTSTGDRTPIFSPGTGRPPGRKRLDGELTARFVSATEIAANGYDLNISRYIKQTTTEQADLPTLIEAYNLARAERQKTEQHMLAVLADAGIKGFDE
ncbi:hypothetical protein [Micromonospora sp. NBC_00617]|uniref:hypothetical protein n=1 Tax=Micromonospora sp. NBC_00617 TaxID=2903587 RepID=UPI0030E0B244